MAKPLFTWTDPDTGAVLTVNAEDILLEVEGEGFYVSRPTGEDAVALARAVLPDVVLTDAGDTGHVVVDVARTSNLMRMCKESGARSMREAAAELAEHWGSGLMARSQLAAPIRALPLLPSEDGEPTPDNFTGQYVSFEYGEWEASGHECGDIDPNNDDCEQPVMHRTVTAVYVDRRVPLGTELEPHDAHVGRRWDDREDEADPCRSYTVIVGIDVYCEHSSGAGHDGLHYADVAGTTRTWADQATEGKPAPALVHVATPERITPCGEGTLDTIVAALIAEVTCMECLRAIATERGEQVVELRRELDAESARVSAARDERDQALRAARELPARTTQLEHDMSRAESRLDALELAARERQAVRTEEGGA